MKKDKNTEQKSVKDRLIEFLKYKDISQGAFEKECGLSNGYINNIRKSISDKTFNKIHDKFPELNKYWLLFNDGEMLTTSEDLEEHNASILRKGRNKKQIDEVVPIPRNDYMMVEFEDLETSAGLLGTGDVSTLPKKKTRLVPHEYEKGSYLVVRISGDSMDDGTKRALSSGDEVLVKLYTDNIDFLPIRQKLFVVNTYNGSVVKQITKIDKEAQTITCHSFNPAFKDFEVDFDEILQIFTVEKIVNSKIRF